MNTNKQKNKCNKLMYKFHKLLIKNNYNYYLINIHNYNNNYKQLMIN